MYLDGAQLTTSDQTEGGEEPVRYGEEPKGLSKGSNRRRGRRAKDGFTEQLMGQVYSSRPRRVLTSRIRMARKSSGRRAL